MSILYNLVLLLVNCRNSLYILDTNPPWDTWYATIPFGRLLLHSIASFAIQKFLSLVWPHLSHLSIFAFSSCALMSSQKNHLKIQSHGFFWEFHSFRTYVYVLNPFWANFHIQYKNPTSLWVLDILYSHHDLLKNRLSFPFYGALESYWEINWSHTQGYIFKVSLFNIHKLRWCSHSIYYFVIFSLHIQIYINDYFPLYLFILSF